MNTSGKHSQRRLSAQGGWTTIGIAGGLAAAGAAVWVLASAFLAAEGRLMRLALVNEAQTIINALRNHQADHAEALSSFADAAEAGWPDGVNNCAGGLAELSRLGYLAPVNAYGTVPAVSRADARLRWHLRCDGDAVTIELSSFGADWVCSDDPENVAAPCPEADLAVLVAAATGGAPYTEDDPGTAGASANDGPAKAFTSNNRFVRWSVFRGASYPALQRLGSRLLWRDFASGQTAGVPLPTSALSGIRLGPAEGPDTVEYPPGLAHQIQGPDTTGAATPDNSDDTAASGILNGLAMSMFYRARVYPFAAVDDDIYDTDASNDATLVPPVSALPVGSCPSGNPPTWQLGVESLRIVTRGYELDPAGAGLNLKGTPAGPDDAGGGTLLPTAWQAYDAGGITDRFRPEILVSVMLVLEPITGQTLTNVTFAGGPVASGDFDCPSHVLQGVVDSSVAAGPGWPYTAETISRACTRTDTGTPQVGALSQAVEAIPYVDLAWHCLSAAADCTNLTPDDLALRGRAAPSVRLVAAAYCDTFYDLRP